MFQFAGFASHGYVFTMQYPKRVGFPIRISVGQRLLAPRHGFSQPVTSFIASIRQGIHQMPLRHLRAPPYPESKALHIRLVSKLTEALALGARTPNQILICRIFFQHVFNL